MILEEILSQVGRNNRLGHFPAKLGFDEANMRLVNYNKASKEKEEKVGSSGPRSSGERAAALTPPPLCRWGQRRPLPEPAPPAPPPRRSARACPRASRATWRTRTRT